jgi:enoyl-CoA hydratase
VPAEPSPPVLVEREGHVALVRLNRPDLRNTLSPELMEELATALETLDRTDGVRAIVVAGDERAFAAGADIHAMRARSFQETLTHPTARFWPRVAAIGVPLIAAVSGYAFGGGCELALSCDLIVASETAVFSQAEITLGIIPGGGATQRLARVAGKQRAMELVLTGRRFDAAEAHAMGLVNRVTAPGAWLDEALDLARTIAERPPLAVRFAKRAVLGADDGPIGIGLSLERRLYEQSMATEDRVEGMTAFLERREPQWRGR